MPLVSVGVCRVVQGGLDGVADELVALGHLPGVRVPLRTVLGEVGEGALDRSHSLSASGISASAAAVAARRASTRSASRSRHPARAPGTWRGPSRRSARPDLGPAVQPGGLVAVVAAWIFAASRARGRAAGRPTSRARGRSARANRGVRRRRHERDVELLFVRRRVEHAQHRGSRFQKSMTLSHSVSGSSACSSAFRRGTRKRVMPSRERSRFSGIPSESRTAEPTPSAPMTRSASAVCPVGERDGAVLGRRVHLGAGDDLDAGLARRREQRRWRCGRVMVRQRTPSSASCDVITLFIRVSYAGGVIEPAMRSGRADLVEHLEAVFHRTIPAPSVRNSLARSCTRTVHPRLARATAAVSPAKPPPEISALRVLVMEPSSVTGRRLTGAARSDQFSLAASTNELSCRSTTSGAVSITPCSESMSTASATSPRSSCRGRSPRCPRS